MAAKVRDPALVDAIAVVFADVLSFYCPKAKKMLFTLLTGATPVSAGPVAGISVNTMAGVQLTPTLPTVAGETVLQLHARIAAVCPEFPLATIVLYCTHNTGGRSKAMREVSPRNAGGEENTVEGLEAVYVVRKAEHDIEVTHLRNEYERGDIACPRCKRKGPCRYTCHESCVKCKCCACCAILYNRCGVPVDIEPYTPDINTAEGAETQAKLDALLARFYEWQRGIMKPY